MTNSDPGKIRIRKNAEAWRVRGWTAVPNALILRADISWEAKGAFTWLSLASDDPEFDVTADSLWHAGPMGRNKSQELVRELERAGFLTRTYVVGDDGRPAPLYELWPEPVADEDNTYRPSTAKRRKGSFPQVKAENPDVQTSGSDLRKRSAAENPDVQTSGSDLRKRDSDAFPQVKAESLNVRALARAGERTSYTERPSSPSLPPSRVRAREAGPDRMEGGTDEPMGQEGTTRRPEMAGERRTAPPAGWASDLVLALPYGRHIRPNAAERAELAALVEAAHTEHGLSQREIARYLRGRLNQATTSAVSYLRGALQPDRLPEPAPIEAVPDVPDAGEHVPTASDEARAAAMEAVRGLRRSAGS